MTRTMMAQAGLILILTAGAAWGQGGPAPVDVATPLAQRIVDYDTYTGRFQAVTEVEIRARVSGYLDRVAFQDGDMVAEGDLLFVIDQSTFRAALARAEAALAAARATRDLAVIEQTRARTLANRNVGTAQEVDRTAASLAEAEAQVAVAEADVQTARLDLAFTEVRAPIAGRISDSKVDEGNLVVGGANQATLLTTLVSVDPIHFAFTASEADFLRYARLTGGGENMADEARDTPVFVRLMDEADFTREGRMNFVDTRLDPNSGTIVGRAVLPNPDGFLVPGVFGRLRLPGSNEYDALLLPEAAIQSDQAAKIVLTVDPEGNVGAKPVEIGALYRGFRVVRSGLAPTDRVIVNGVQRARPGGKVIVQDVTLALPGE